MTSVEIALTFSLRNTRDIASRSNSKRNKQYRFTVNWQASIYVPMPHQSGAPFASVRSFPKEQWYRAGVFFFSPPPPLLSFFRPRTYRKGYYFYSAQSSTVINQIWRLQQYYEHERKVSPTQNTPALQAKVSVEWPTQSVVSHQDLHFFGWHCYVR